VDNIVMIGCGQAALMHTRTLRNVARALPIFYSSRQGEKAAGFNQRLNGSGWFNSYESALADERIECALIVTPPSTHLEITLLALRHGKHVIVEKPAFLTTAEFDTVAIAAMSANCTVFVGENYFYKPLAFALRDAIGSGAIGDVRYLHVNAMKWQRAAGWRADPALSGGGPLFEGGIHWINLIGNIGLTINSVNTVECGSPMTTLTTAHYSNGAVGTLMYSWETRSLINGVHRSSIYGTNGRILFESNGLFMRVNGRTRFPGFRDLAGYQAMFRDFLFASRPQFTLEMARRDVELALSAPNHCFIEDSNFYFSPGGI
jgi:predicted dehydrogenase